MVSMRNTGWARDLRSQCVRDHALPFLVHGLLSYIDACDLRHDHEASVCLDCVFCRCPTKYMCSSCEVSAASAAIELGTIPDLKPDVNGTNAGFERNHVIRIYH